MYDVRANWKSYHMRCLGFLYLRTLSCNKFYDNQLQECVVITIILKSIIYKLSQPYHLVFFCFKPKVYIIFIYKEEFKTLRSKTNNYSSLGYGLGNILWYRDYVSDPNQLAHVSQWTRNYLFSIKMGFILVWEF